MVFLESFSPAVFSWGDIFTSQGTFVSVWRCALLSQVGRLKVKKKKKKVKETSIC